MNTAREALQTFSLGQPFVVHNLHVVPLLVLDPVEPGYRMAADAIRAGLLLVREVSDDGSVPTLFVKNDSDRPVLLLDGDQLIGCKQNRVLNLTILVPAHSEITIPVSCVEQGRWHSNSRNFGVSDRGMYAELRAEKVAQVSQSLLHRGRPQPSQSALWSAIEQKACAMGSSSATSAMDDVYRCHEGDVSSYVAGVPPQSGQCGAIYLINGRLAGLECLNDATAWAACAASVTSGYALDAIHRKEGAKEAVSPAVIDGFLSRLAESSEAHFKSIGLGVDVRIEAEELTGSALTLDGQFVHLCAFDRASRDWS